MTQDTRDTNTNDSRPAIVRPIRASLIVVGSFATGKTTTCGILSELTGAPYIDMGTLVQREAALRGLDLLTHAANQFAKGNTVFMKSVVDEAQTLGRPSIVAGLRRVDQLEYLKEHLAPAFSVALTLPDDERLRRLTRRRFTEDPGKEWSEREALEESWGISDAIAACDVRLSSAAPAQPVAEECLARWLAFERRQAR